MVGEQQRIEAAAREACGLDGHCIADVALQAASLLTAKLFDYYDCRHAAAVLEALLKAAVAA